MRHLINVNRSRTLARGVVGFSTGGSPKKYERLRRGFHLYNGVSGRDELNTAFHKRVFIVPERTVTDLFADWTESVAVVDPLRADQLRSAIEHPSLLPPFTAVQLTRRPYEIKDNLLKNGDTYALRLAGRCVIHVLEPELDSETYRYPEALVEMASAYRNIFNELDEWPGIRTLRVPALSLHSHHQNLAHSFAKLHQQAIDVAFQRLNTAIREAIIYKHELRVEIYVPAELHETYARTFTEVPYEVPMDDMSVPANVHPFYNSLPPPRTLLEYPAYIGHRKEIREAIESGTPVKTIGARGLDGKTIVEQDVPTTLSLLPDNTERDAYLAAERATALEDGFAPVTYDPLASAPAPDLPRH